jgi:hypothetical protein
MLRSLYPEHELIEWHDIDEPTLPWLPFALAFMLSGIVLGALFVAALWWLNS